MQLPWLSEHDTLFPPTALALDAHTDAPGLLAAGGGLSVARLRAAYRQGIFPWYGEGQPVLWWTTDPRMVLPVAEFKLSRSLRKTLRRFLNTPGCELRFDHDFAAIVAACAGTPREGQHGSWIVPEVAAAYLALHRAGHAHSVETWIDGQLAGGLYLVSVGRMVFGESMFAWRTDASKIALAALVAFCQAHQIPLIDCQQQTSHLASLGARPIGRSAFEAHLAQVVDLPAPEPWAYDPDHWAPWLTPASETAADRP
jgi:leucyl/phenylalanyl-tRNA--protein transferase